MAASALSSHERDAAPESSGHAELLQKFSDAERRAQQKLRARSLVSALPAAAVCALASVVAGSLLLGLRASTSLAMRATLAGGALFIAASAITIWREARHASSRLQLALAIDAWENGHEAVTTSVFAAPGARFEESTLQTAHAALTRHLAAPFPIPTWARGHALALPFAALALLAIVWPGWLPRPPTKTAHAEATEIVKLDAPGLGAVAAWKPASAASEAQKARIDAIAKQAEKLKADLRNGIPRAEAAKRTADLRQALTAERGQLAEHENRAGFEAAREAMKGLALEAAERSLAQRDLSALDAAMEALASKRETQDREAARAGLREAAAAAKRAGNADLARILEAERKHLDAAAKRADQLRALADAMRESGAKSETLERQLERMDRGEAGASSALGDALADALSKLSDAQRKKLAEQLAKNAGKAGASSPEDQQALEALAKRLATPEGQRELEQALKDLADRKDAGEAGEQGDEMDRAEDGLDDTERRLSGALEGSPSPAPAPPKSGSSGSSGGSSGSSGGSSGGPGGSSGSSGGPGGHGGNTAAVGADTVAARAATRRGGGRRLPSSGTSYAPGRTETAQAHGSAPSSPLPAAIEGELNGTDTSEVPEAYRTQVREYFQQ